MKHLLCALAVLLAMASLATAQKTDERPEYAGMYHLTVVYNSPMTTTDSVLHNFMRTNPIMKQLTQQTVYNEYTNDRRIISNTMWRDYLGAARPAVLLQGPTQSNGRADVIFYALGNQVDCSKNFTDVLRSALKEYVQRSKVPTDARGQWNPRCPDGRCPLVPGPKTPPPPPTTPPPAVTPIIPPSIDIDVDLDRADPPPEPADEGTPILLYLIVGGLAGAAGLYASQKKSS